MISYSPPTSGFGVSPTGQSSNLEPAMTEFRGQLWIAYVGPSSGNIELIYSEPGSAFSEKMETGIGSPFAPSLLGVDGVPPPANLGGQSQ